MKNKTLIKIIENLNNDNYDEGLNLIKKNIIYLNNYIFFKKTEPFSFHISSIYFNKLKFEKKQEQKEILLKQYNEIIDLFQDDLWKTYHNKYTTVNIFEYIFSKFNLIDNYENFKFFYDSLFKNNNFKKNIKNNGAFFLNSIQKELKKTYNNDNYEDFLDYFLNLYLNNSDLDINNNNNLVFNLITQCILNDSINTNLIDKLISSNKINIDKSIIRKNLENFYLTNYFYSLPITTEKFLHKNNFDYIEKDNEKYYIYPFFKNIEDKNKNKVVFFNNNKIFMFDNIHHFHNQIINIKDKNIKEIQKYKIYDISSLLDIEYLYEDNYYSLIAMDNQKLINKINFIKKNSIPIDLEKLCLSFNNYLEKLYYDKKLLISNKEPIEKNIHTIINFFIENLNYNNNEQIILKTLNDILKLFKPNFIENKIKNLKFNDNHYYDSIKFKDILNVISVTSNFKGHLLCEKSLISEIKKNLKYINDEQLYNNNSLFSFLFNKNQIFNHNIIQKKIKIFKLLKSHNKIDELYTINNGEKVLTSEYLIDIIKERKLYNNDIIISFYLNELLNLNKKLTKKNSNFINDIYFHLLPYYNYNQSILNKLHDYYDNNLEVYKNALLKIDIKNIKFEHLKNIKKIKINEDFFITQLRNKIFFNSMDDILKIESIVKNFTFNDEKIPNMINSLKEKFILEKCNNYNNIQINKKRL